MDDTEVAPRKHGAASLVVACRHIVNYMERMSVRHPGFREFCPCCYEFARSAAEPGAQVFSVRWR